MVVGTRLNMWFTSISLLSRLQLFWHPFTDFHLPYLPSVSHDREGKMQFSNNYEIYKAGAAGVEPALMLN
jgi:hypothetical protein